MNRRLAKKAVKKKHHLRKYPGDIEPRMLDRLLSEFKDELAKAIDNAVMFGNRETAKTFLNSLYGSNSKFYVSMPRHHGEIELKNLFAKAFNIYIATGEM